MNPVPYALSAAQAAELLGVSKQTVYRAVRAGDLDSFRLAGRVVIPAAPLLDRLGITREGVSCDHS